MGTRRTREEAMKLEDHAVQLAARGCSVRQIAAVLGLSESEARRKRQVGLRRRRWQEGEGEVWASVEAQLSELLRVGYQDLDRAPAGTPARVGTLKAILEVVERIARLHGLELRRAAPEHRDGQRLPGAA